MSKIDNLTRLRHMRDAAVEALGFVGGRKRNDLDTNRMLVLALVKDIEIIGEAATNLSADCRNRYPQLPWADIIGMRNRLVHAYDALAWAIGKSLSDQDYQFLAASQTLDRQDIQAALDTERKARAKLREELLQFLKHADIQAALDTERKDRAKLREEFQQVREQATASLVILRWLPVVALATLALISWPISVQGFLLDRRVFVQAIYRKFTNQVPTTKPPPVLLVQIDEESIAKAGISNPNPMNRSYLAQLVDKLSAMKVKVIGIDYLLDRPQKENDQKLAESLRASVQKQGTWFVLATKRSETGGWLEVLPKLAHPNWSLQGDVLVLGNDLKYMTLLPGKDSDSRRLPFAYLLALAYGLNFNQKSGQPPQPQLQAAVGWLPQLKAYVTDTTSKDYKILFSPLAGLQPLTNFSYRLRQMWLHPIIDFSIPPEQVYKRLPAWQLLESSADSLKLNRDQQPVVMIAPGGYGEAGVSKAGEDNFPVPVAVDYWRSRQNPRDQRQVFPGGEAHAYMIHHFLNQRLVVPIPDLWLVGVVALLGKVTALALEKGKKEKEERKILFNLVSGKGKWVLLSVLTTVYGLVSLQLYITAAVLLPWFLPSATFWTLVLLAQPTQKR